jgi:hypothetical protein
MSTDIEKAPGSAFEIVSQDDMSSPAETVDFTHDLFVPENDDEVKAFDVLQRKGILPVVLGVAKSVSPDRRPAVDVARKRYPDQTVRTVVALRWAPQSDPEQGFVSKVARIELYPNDRMPPSVVYPHRIKEGRKGAVVVDWRAPDPLSDEAIRMPLDRKLLFAMSATTVKMKDNRTLEEGVLIGRPGVGVLD